MTSRGARLVSWTAAGVSFAVPWIFLAQSSPLYTGRWAMTTAIAWASGLLLGVVGSRRIPTRSLGKALARGVIVGATISFCLLALVIVLAPV